LFGDLVPADPVFRKRLDAGKNDRTAGCGCQTEVEPGGDRSQAKCGERGKQQGASDFAAIARAQPVGEQNRQRNQQRQVARQWPVQAQARVIGEASEHEIAEDRNQRAHREQVPGRTAARAPQAHQRCPQQRYVEQWSADDRLLDRLDQRIGMEGPRIAVDELKADGNPVMLDVESKQRREAEQRNRKCQPNASIAPESLSTRHGAEEDHAAEQQHRRTIVAEPRARQRDTEQAPVAQAMGAG
jgi:hypothetical protein